MKKKTNNTILKNSWYLFIQPTISLALLIFLISYSSIFNDIGLIYYPISFGLIIGLFNWKYLKIKISKFKIVSSILVSIIISLSAFFLGIFSLSLNDFFESILGNDLAKYISIIFGTCIIATLTLYFLYSKAYDIDYELRNYIIIVLTIIFLIIYLIFHFKFIGEYITNDKLSVLLSPYAIWQFTIALGLQLILNKK